MGSLGHRVAVLTPVRLLTFKLTEMNGDKILVTRTNTRKGKGVKREQITASVKTHLLHRMLSTD